MPALDVGALGAMPDGAHQDGLAGDVHATDDGAGEPPCWGSIHDEDGAAAEALAQGYRGITARAMELMAKHGKRGAPAPMPRRIWHSQARGIRGLAGPLPRAELVPPQVAEKPWFEADSGISSYALSPEGRTQDGDPARPEQVRVGSSSPSAIECDRSCDSGGQAITTAIATGCIFGSFEHVSKR